MRACMHNYVSGARENGHRPKFLYKPNMERKDDKSEEKSKHKLSSSLSSKDLNKDLSQNLKDTIVDDVSKGLEGLRRFRHSEIRTEKLLSSCEVAALLEEPFNDSNNKVKLSRFTNVLTKSGAKQTNQPVSKENTVGTKTSTKSHYAVGETLVAHIELVRNSKVYQLVPKRLFQRQEDVPNCTRSTSVTCLPLFNALDEHSRGKIDKEKRDMTDKIKSYDAFFENNIRMGSSLRSCDNFHNDCGSIRSNTAANNTRNDYLNVELLLQITNRICHDKLDLEFIGLEDKVLAEHLLCKLPLKVVGVLEPSVTVSRREKSRKVKEMRRRMRKKAEEKRVVLGEHSSSDDNEF